MTKFWALGTCVALIGVDQLLKQWALATLAQGTRIAVIPGLFYLSYVENRGAAFGIFQDKTMVLAVVSAVIMLVAVSALVLGVVKDRFLIWSISLVLAGGVGNCIDRFSRGFVVDYLDFSALGGFPVFNFADCCVVTGTAMILIYVLYTDRAQARKRQAADTGTAKKVEETEPTFIDTSGEIIANAAEEVAADTAPAEQNEKPTGASSHEDAGEATP